MDNGYITVKSASAAEITEKKSKFIAYVKPVSSEADAQSFIEEIRKKHWDARHNVFSYRIGEKNVLERYSDDGEPSGTAGMPVLDVLRGNDIHNAVVVVTRYFGGILLGTGGLVRAYGKAAKDVITNAGLIKKTLFKIIKITADYSLSGKIQYETINQGYIIEDTEYTDNVRYTVLCQKGSENKLINSITEATSAKASIEDAGEKYLDIEI